MSEHELESEAGEDLPGCDRPPPGWVCTRERGHDGPCAAVRVTVNDSEPEPELELRPAAAPPWWAWALVGTLLALDLKLVSDLLRARAFSRLTENYLGTRAMAQDGLSAWLDRLLEEE